MFLLHISFFTNLLESFFNGWDILIITLLYFVIIDYITGIMVSMINHKLSSEVGFKGIFKKIMIFFMVGLSVKLDMLLNISELRYIVIMFYIVNEGISILENASLLGLPIPNKIKQIFDKLDEK